jgi:hypothetical protein
MRYLFFIVCFPLVINAVAFATMPPPSNLMFRFFGIYVLTFLPALLIALTDEICDRKRPTIRAAYCAAVGFVLTPVPLIVLVSSIQYIWSPKPWLLMVFLAASAPAAYACSLFFARVSSPGQKSPAERDAGYS